MVLAAGALSTLVTALLTAQLAGALAIFFLVRRYNPGHRRRFHEAKTAFSRPDAGNSFELPAFRDGARCEWPNPFENTTWRMTLYEQVKVSAVAVTLMPFRVMLVVAAFVWAWVCARFCLRCRLPGAAKLAVRLGCRAVLAGYGYPWVTVRGSLDEEAAVLVSNHCSFLDGVVLLCVAGPRIFAEKSYFTNFVFKVFAEALEVVTFDRSGKEARKQARQTMEAAAVAAAAGAAPPVLIFPEGTTKSTQAIISFKDGAFAPGQPVQPVLLRYKFRHCDPAWVYAGPGSLMLQFRMLCQFVNSLEVEFLPLCRPTDAERASPGLFARRVQQEMARALGVSVVDVSVEDALLQQAAVKVKLPPEAGVIGFPAVKEACALTPKRVQRQLRVFSEMGATGGVVSFEAFEDSFRRCFHAPSAAQRELLHSFYDLLTGETQQMCFRKFLVGLALVRSERDGEPGNGLGQGQECMHTKLAFAAFAASSDARILPEEFDSLWAWLHPPESLGSGAVAEAAQPASSQEIFAEIAGASTNELSFDAFRSYTQRKPDFLKQLRLSLWSRLAAELAPQ